MVGRAIEDLYPKSVRSIGEAVLEVENLVPGTRVRFFIGGAAVGGAAADALGKASLKRDTQLGQPVPISVAGQPVDAQTAAGQSIATGSF